MYKLYEFGIYSNSMLKTINSEIFDTKLTDKLLLFYSPERTHSNLDFYINTGFIDTLVYDCIELSDGELMVNSGVLNSGPKAKMFHCGGLNSVLPLLEITSQIITSSTEATQLNLE